MPITPHGKQKKVNIVLPKREHKDVLALVRSVDREIKKHIRTRAGINLKDPIIITRIDALPKISTLEKIIRAYKKAGWAQVLIRDIPPLYWAFYFYAKPPKGKLVSILYRKNARAIEKEFNLPPGTF